MPARPADRLRPLADWPQAQRAGLRGVLTDIDDTLTTEGLVPASTIAAMAALKNAGLVVMAITGRPVGWSLPFAASWPIDAIVAENGAVALLREPNGQVRKLYQQADAKQRLADYQRLQQVAQHIVRSVPGASLAQDSAGRETDIAIDHSEFTQMAPAQIEAVLQLMRSAGLHASVSSIHINGWLGEHNKLQGAHWIVQTLLQRRLEQELDAWAYIGDSSNDQLMFEAFASSVGVANVARFVPHLQHLPRYVTPSARGAGFEEMVQAILAARASST